MTKKTTKSYKIIDIDIDTDPKFHTRDRYIVKADFIENNKKVHSIKHAFSIKIEEKEIKTEIAKACKVWFDDRDNGIEEKKQNEVLKKAEVKKNNLIGKGGTI